MQKANLFHLLVVLSIANASFQSLQAKDEWKSEEAFKNEVGGLIDKANNSLNTAQNAITSATTAEDITNALNNLKAGFAQGPQATEEINILTVRTEKSTMGKLLGMVSEKEHEKQKEQEEQGPLFLEPDTLRPIFEKISNLCDTISQKSSSILFPDMKAHGVHKVLNNFKRDTVRKFFDIFVKDKGKIKKASTASDELLKAYDNAIKNLDTIKNTIDQ